MIDKLIIYVPSEAKKKQKAGNGCFELRIADFGIREKDKMGQLLPQMALKRQLARIWVSPFPNSPMTNNTISGRQEDKKVSRTEYKCFCSFTH
ncbi:hypothetical protein B9Z55_024392 [Caenorhabditis nigoni]|uniref:Uncharacterized protein n=1 Tax=Caenorhabditis nigoni TaxID=1611254 RepID=A0A2G5SU92_9PELO|nr:hypothetical protein B9Z55_024392 [Caenorhabditis nigoni]